MNVNWGIKTMDKRYGILIVSLTMLILCFVGAASATNWSVDGSGGADFTGIQEAINNASAGDTIIVHSGVYYENVVVYKSVTLKGLGHPVVDAGGKGNAVRLTADGITLEGFTVANSGRSQSDAGINVNSSNNNITSNNVCNNNRDGIHIYHSNNNTITGNNVSNNYYGISLGDSRNNTITGSIVCNNSCGISLVYSIKSTITGNIVRSNNLKGILLYCSGNNHLYLNNLINNTDNAYWLWHRQGYESANIWNSTEKITYTYDGTTYKSYLGNYWDDYEGKDVDADGIGNKPYSINTSYSIYYESDVYPLMKPFENYIRG
jgi:parallel beta-helix repeat protein